MKKVFQTETGRTGNCWQAAVASVLELSLEDVPHFLTLGAEINRWETYVKFMRDHDVTVLNVPIRDHDHFLEVMLYNRLASGHVLLAVEGKHEGLGHCVVGYMENGGVEIVHDPNPENADRAPETYKIIGIDFLLESPKED